MKDIECFYLFFFFFFVLESDVVRNGAYQAHNVSQFWYKEKMSREDGRFQKIIIFILIDLLNSY